MKDRIVGFIKIAQNISVFPTNIPRLRTLNFTAALEPYLKTNNSDVLDSTINILTWIKIGEVLDTNWVTSEDAPSSQSAAPNWQTAVERVTGLISNELKDLHDIEWKEENGAYKIKILMSFKLIRYVYFALETRNAPVVYVKQFRKDIASVLIDANIIPKICGVFTDLHHHTLEITDNKISKILSSDAQSIILCNTYSSMEFAEYVANVSGFLEFIMAKLASEGKRHLHLDNEVMLDYY